MATVEQRPIPSPRGVGSAAALPERLYLALNAHADRMLSVQLAMYFAAAFALAAIKPFWFDELITFNIARQQSPAAIWQLLLHAADPNPPLSHLLTALSMHFFGRSEIAVRLPGICAGALTLFCIYEFLIRRLPAVFAASGVFFYLTTHAFDYAYEARSYSYMICFSALALVAWRWTHESRRQGWAALLLAASLAAAVSSNYYGVLIFFAIAAAELVSTFERRNIAWRVWLALAAGAAPMIAYLPLIHAAEARFSPFAWNKPYPEFMIDAYTQMMETSVWLALAAVYSVIVVLVYERINLGLRRTPILRLPEFVAVSVLAAFPVLGYAMSVLRGGMLSPRCVIAFCVGVSIAVAIAAFKLIGRSPLASLLFLLGCFCWFAYHAGDIASDYSNQRQALDRIIFMLPKQGTIVVPDSLLATTLNFYAPPALAERVIFAMDLPAVRKYKHEDSPEQNLAAAPQIYSVPIVPLEQFQQDHPVYYILGPEDNWMIQKLREDEVSVRRIPLDFRSHDLGGFTPLAHHDVSLFRVDEWPGNFIP
jgi:4-amino-4-deoxy-L-arabinose transferase-like glycosyltransferase